MRGKPKSKSPDIIYRDGKPAAVVLDIDDYQEMLERLEDSDDAKKLREIRKKPLKFRKLEDFLEECEQLV